MLLVKVKGVHKACVMVLGLGVNLIPPLLVFNLVFYITGACLASWGLNLNIDSQNLYAQNDIGDTVTTFFLPMAIFSCMVGLASVLAGVRHLCFFKPETLAVASSTSMIAWVIDLISLGFAVKEVEVGGGRRPGRLKVVEAFVIVLSISELFNLLMLHEESCGVESINNINFMNQGNNVCRPPGMYNQVGTPHVHHHHPHGPMIQQPSSSC